jgi:aryl-alcohol dehydrogenase-like predicted oxidoreductase
VDVVSVQNRYNVADRSSDTVLAACERDGIAFIPWSPLSQNPREANLGARVRLAAWAASRGVSLPRAAAAWLLARSPAMLPIPGTSRVEHLEDNWAAATLGPTAEEMAAIG